MGYHRDPAIYQQFSPFEIEMRRRMWHFVAQTDLLFSFQLGLPTVVRRDEYDTLAPQNFSEEQLRPAIPEMPEPKPADEPTHISYMIAKLKIFEPFRRIVEQSNSLRRTDYETVLALHDLSIAARAAIPPHLQHLPGPEASISAHAQSAEYAVPTNLLLKRIQLDIFYHKIMCVLHRKFIALGLSDPQYTTSTNACVDSALALLDCQKGLHLNEQTLWKQIRWNSFSLSQHDFVLAAMILCLYLTAVERTGGGPGKASSGAPEGRARAVTGTQRDATARKGEIEEALAKSLSMWREVRHTYRDAARACDVLERMVCAAPFSPWLSSVSLSIILS